MGRFNCKSIFSSLDQEGGKEAGVNEQVFC